MIFGNLLGGAARELYDRLYTTEFDPASLRKDLDAGKYDADSVNMAALEYVDDCTLQMQEIEWAGEKAVPGETNNRIESGHVKETIELLLDFGLDPNRVFTYPDSKDECNIMDALYLIDNGYQGADALYLLLSHGGNPDLEVDREFLYSDPYYDLWFDTVNRDMLTDSLYSAKIHYCMVLIGFGAGAGRGRLPLDPVDGFDLSKLRNHRDYYVGAIHSDKSDDGMELCFFDRNTNWEVARY